MAEAGTLHDAFIDELRDTYDAERQLTKALATLAKAATAPSLRQDRLVTAIENPAVRILAHPRGRISGSRAGVVADWSAVFGAAAREAVAIEIDGDPARQDVDYSLACGALDAGCLFALDSDADTTAQLSYAETAVAHARLAGIPTDRIVNCWPLDRLLAWLAEPCYEGRS
jgi:histidinol phosphatase-like PHP family hydrolase